MPLSALQAAIMDNSGSSDRRDRCARGMFCPERPVSRTSRLHQVPRPNAVGSRLARRNGLPAPVSRNNAGTAG